MRDLRYILLLVVICLGILWIVNGAHAENVTTNITTIGSYAITDDPTYEYHAPYRINQGDTVYINDTIDISGMGWGTGVAWYGTYGEYEDAQYIRKFTGFRRDVQNFWIDPSIFTGKDGMWYQYYDNLDYQERRGNLEAFFVKGGYRQSTLTYPNGTMINQSVGVHGVVVEREPPREVILPEIRVSDYLVAIGDPLQANFTKMWVFGRVDGIYNHEGNLAISEVQGLEIGSYKIVSHDAGRNTIYEVGYSNDKFTSPWKGVEDESIYGSQPMLDIEKFKAMIGKTDDIIQTFNLVVEEPVVSIVSIDEVDVGNRIPNAWEPGMTLLDVRGYSNVQNGTILTFVMDPETHNSREIKDVTFTTNVIRTSPGSKSFYRIYIPINKNQMWNGIHTLKVSTPIGGQMFYNFPISELPADSHVPNATLKYIGDSNPWKPNMTIPDPIIIEKERVVEKVITVQITPSDDVVYAAQKKAQDEAIGFWATAIIGGGATLLGFVFVGWYLVSVVRRM